MARRLLVKVLALLLSAALLVSCNPFGLRDLLEAATRSALSIEPRNVSLPAGANLTFSADGGVPPYSYTATNGSIDIATGEYTAPLAAGSATITATDFVGTTASTGVTITELGTGLALSPSSITVSVNTSLTFEGVGGTGPYTYSFQSTGSGSPDINPATGYYVAGSIGATTDVVRVTDALAATATATVSVVALASAVDYSVTSTAGLPASGVAGSVIPGGLTFRVQNAGPGDGAVSVDWTVYLSADAVLGGGDIVVDEGTTPALDDDEWVDVALSGTYPAAPLGGGFLIVRVDSADDTSPGNNTSGATAFTLNPRPIDYRVPVVNHTGGSTTGQAVNGNFTVENQLGAAGSSDFSWYVYASVDTTVGVGDYLLQWGSHAPLAGTSSDVISLTSAYWPAIPAMYRLLVWVSAADDTVGTNDTGWTSQVDVQGVVPPDINYQVAAPAFPVGTVAGDDVSGTFDVTNAGGAAGVQTLFWTVYRSADATLDGGDPVLAVGSRTGFAPGPQTVGWAGTWPAGAATWHLFVRVSAVDDINPLNNDSTGTAVPVTAPVVDYVVESFNETSSVVAGDPITGTLQIRNTAGGDDGTQTVSWTVYVSEDATLLPAGDHGVDAGTIGPLAAGVSSAVIPFDGTWPVSPYPPWTWRLYLVVDAADEVDPGDNTSGAILRTTQPPNADYDVVSVSGVNGTAGRNLTGSFILTNLGPHDGTQAVPWRAYLSTNTTYEVGIDTLVDSDVIASPGLPASTPMGPIPIDGIWAVQPGSWYLIIVLNAGDDQIPGNNADASGLLVASAPNVDYIVPTVTLNAGLWIPDKPVSGTFQYRNNGLQAGSPMQTVSWEVFASTNPTIDGDDALVDFGTGEPALGSATTSGNIIWAGSWPLTYGNYYLLVRVSCAEDILNGNNVGSTAVQQTIGVYDAESAEPNNDYTLLTDSMPLDITLRPGLAVMITGTMANGDRDDIFRFNTGTSDRVVITIDWVINAPNVRIYLWGGPSVLLKGVSGLNKSMSLDWEVDAAGVDRWINVDNYWTGSDYAPPPNPVFLNYTCWIVAY